MKGYKVLTHNLRSPMAPMFMQYHENKVNTPEELNGPLGVFDSLKNAKEFAEMYAPTVGRHRIFECEYEPSEIDNFWWHAWICGVHQKCYSTCTPPRGTRYAVSLVLTKEVKW